MKVDIQRIEEGEESVVVRYKELTPKMNRIIGILKGEENRLWGRNDEGSVSVSLEDIFYVESVDDKVFAYTREEVIRLEGSLNSFIGEVQGDLFFRCSKSMIINVNKVSALKSLSSNRIDATMENGEHIMISRRYASDFRRLLRGYK
ncbi:MAG: LytTR family transcriptional regulator DNA-binding domain-containing protein [Lachnospiraceae bacterium]|nr:LytTR family transcriptional regulator DNA-binding domain-containing protein [Lachnospiraceae bacterium]